MTTAAIPVLASEGTHSLLSLASKAVGSLHLHYNQQWQTALTVGDEDSEAESVENVYDVELTLQELDPVCFVDRRLSTGEVVKSCYIRKFN
jgi:hypothetical protein